MKPIHFILTAIITSIVVVLGIMAGCQEGQRSDPNALGQGIIAAGQAIKDANGANPQTTATILRETGQTVAATGAATGNTALTIIGSICAGVGGFLGASVANRKKQEGNKNVP